VTTETLSEQVTRLERKNAQLEKINRVLIDRVEQGGGNQSDPYSAFEHSVQLAEQVREKTQALNETLEALERSHLELKSANHQANIFKQRFVDAIESMSDGFVLLDCDGVIILQNSNFTKFWNHSNLPIKQGVNFKDFKELAKVRGIISQAYPGDSENSPVYQLSDGRWFQLNERRTLDGGWVMLYTDITAIKTAESQRFDQAMSQKSRLLQNLVDNLSQGVVLLNGYGQIEVWNSRFAQMSNLSAQMLQSSPSLAQIQHLTELDLTPKTGNNENFDLQVLSNGTVLEVREHLLISGQLIKTFTDITQRHRYAQSLESRRNWLTLITDNVPAMIAYVGADLKFQFINKGYLDWYNLPAGSLVGDSLETSRVLGDYHLLEPYIAQALSGHSVSFEIEERTSNRAVNYLLKSYVPNKDNTGQVLGFFVLVRDVTERRNSAKALQQAHDELEKRVEQRTAQLQLVNDKLLNEVDERRLAQSNLVNAKREAEVANHSKSKFLAAVSHDLLQPLNAAMLFLGAMSDVVVKPGVDNLITGVSNSLLDLENLIVGLVDISKLDAGIVIGEPHSFRLSQLLDNLAAEYRQLAPKYEIDFKYVASDLVIHSDSALLARILRNLLSNAFRYGGQGKVLLGVRRRKHHVSIEVWDNGLGIAQSELADIFQEFKRLEGADIAFGNGLGLGLAIVDKLSAILNHPIDVRSTLGKGSVFSIEVPIGQQIASTAATTDLPVALNSLTNVKVWVVDNDQQICDAMAILLKKWGCQVITALSEQALAEQVNIANAQVDILIVDYHLAHGRTGLALAAIINQQRAEVVPVLMITANYSQQLQTQMKDSDILLLNKPIKPMKLKAAMLHLLN